MNNHHSFPNFIILGAAKAGTTALYHYLKQHPQIYMTPLKETNYFALKDEPLNFCGPGDADFVNCLSITTLDAYQAQFRDVHEETAVGEASPLYLYNPKTAARIRDYVPHAKLIAILRNPIDRAYSAFLHLVRDGRETTTDFGEALRLEEERMRAGWEHIWHYRRQGLYYEQLKRYYDVFDAGQIKVYLYYDFRTDPSGMVRDVFRYLGVHDAFVPDMSVRYNDASVPVEQRPPLLPEVRQALHSVFCDDILRLQELIGRDLSRWLSMASIEAESK